MARDWQMFGLFLRPIRSLIFAFIAGLIGYAFANERAHDACLDMGGRMEGAVCHGVP